jgi:4-amino-4-deoxy-L-arabinose transferase
MRSRSTRVLVALGLLAFVLAANDRRGLWESDEGRYTAVALQMLRTQSWMLPRVDDEYVHAAKPPLTYWLIAASVAGFGATEFAARLPNALALWLTCLLLIRLGARYTPGRPWLAPLVSATMLLPFLGAHVITTDSLLALFELAAVASFIEWRFGGGGRLALAGMGAAFGLAFMTKGPPGLLPALAIAVFLAHDGGLRALRRAITPLGVGAFAVLGLAWFGAAIYLRPEFLDYFVRYEVVERVATGVHDRNASWRDAFRVYGPTLLVGALPWWPLSLWAACRRPVGRRSVGEGRWPDRLRGLMGEPLHRFTALWFLLPVLVLALARSRLPLYLLPAFAPIALGVALTLAAIPLGRIRRPLVVALVSGWVVALVAFKVAAAHWDTADDSRAFAAYIRGLDPPSYCEVLFVDSRPSYGLSLYLNTEVEWLTTYPPDGRRRAAPPREQLLDELRAWEARTEGCSEALVITKFENTQRALGVLHHAAATARWLGSWREFAIVHTRIARGPDGD